MGALDIRNPTAITLAETLAAQSKIIGLQSEIIDRLAVELLQHGEITLENLGLMQQAARMREEINIQGAET